MHHLAAALSCIWASSAMRVGFALPLENSHPHPTTFARSECWIMLTVMNNLGKWNHTAIIICFSHIKHYLFHGIQKYNTYGVSLAFIVSSQCQPTLLNKEVGRKYFFPSREDTVRTQDTYRLEWQSIPYPIYYIGRANRRLDSTYQPHALTGKKSCPRIPSETMSWKL